MEDDDEFQVAAFLDGMAEATVAGLQYVHDTMIGLIEAVYVVMRESAQLPPRKP